MKSSKIIKQERVLIGALKHKYSNKTGGIIVLFKDYLNFLNGKNVPYVVFDSNGANYNNVLSYLWSLLKFIIQNTTRNQIVEVHATYKDVISIIPILLLFKRKVVLRKFAGNFSKTFQSATFLQRNLLRKIIQKCSFCFFETREQVSFFQSLNKNTFYLPNVRPKKEFSPLKAYNKKFVFISQVKRTKGIEFLIEAGELLDIDYTIDIFGPILDNEFHTDYLNSNICTYKGVLDSSDVIKVLNEYDALLLPTYHEGEGYPGIIIEAKSIGLPVICSDKGGIPEIVSNEESGVILKNLSGEGLVDGIRKFESLEMNNLRINTYNSFEEFDNIINYRRYNKIISIF